MTRRQVVIHSSLFILTLVSTLVTGGPAYSAAIMTILTAHEMGHYVQCRRYGIPATLPFFIPMPISPFGTMGAVIRMQGPLQERRALFDIAVSGPLAGLVFALPAAVIGIHFSRVVDLAATSGTSMPLGDSILFKGLVRWIAGPIPAGHDLMLHPLAFAGWAGLFVTALNLLPIGQLDGGHILYAMLGKRRALPVSLAFMGGFAVLGVFFYRGWALMIVLILIFGLRHPPFWEEGISLGRPRKLLGAAMLLFFVVSFTPTPIILEPKPASPKPTERHVPETPGVQVSIPETQDGGPAPAVPAVFSASFEPVSGSCR